MQPRRTISCPACGGALPPAAPRCDACGEELAAVEHDARNTPGPAQKAQRLPQQPRRSRQGAMVTMALWQAVIAAVLLFAAGASTLYIVQSTVGNGPSSAAALGGETAAAIRALERRVASDPADMASMLRLANLLHDARRFEAAITRYRSYLLAQPDDADALVDMGICHFELRQYDQAIAAMRDAVARHPDHVQGHYNLGIVCMNAGKPRDAIAWFEATLALHPGENIRTSAQQYIEQLTRDTQ